jgi:hypothetical protein
MKLMKCADGLRCAIGYSEKSMRNLLGEISLLIIYLFICCLIKDAVGKTDYQYTASNEWMTVNHKFETVNEKHSL